MGMGAIYNAMNDFLKIVIVLLSTLRLSTAFTPEILQLDFEIALLRRKGEGLAAARHESAQMRERAGQDSLEIYQGSHVQFVEKCRLSGNNDSAFLFQTMTQIYVAVNSPGNNSVSIRNIKCEEISALPQIQIAQILCDRGICQSGIVHFISGDEGLYALHEEGGFQKAQLLASLKSESRIVGGVLRHRGKDKIEIYISEEKGMVRVFDEEGASKLRLELEGYNNRVTLMADHHPYPLLASSSDWISMLDTTKYGEISQNCPHIPDIRLLLSQNFYGETIYVITTNSIYVMNFEISKRSCSIKRVYDLQYPLTRVTSSAYFSNSLFIDDKVFNLTDGKMYKIEGCHSRMSHAFIYKKNQPEEIYALRQCCESQHCEILLYELKKGAQDRSILFWMTMTFIVILFTSLTCMKKTTAVGLDLEDPVRLREKQIQNQINELTKPKGKEKKK